MVIQQTRGQKTSGLFVQIVTLKPRPLETKTKVGDELLGENERKKITIEDDDHNPLKNWSHSSRSVLVSNGYAHHLCFDDQ